MEESKILIDLEKREAETKLGNIKIVGVPIWRIVRYQSRLHYVTNHSDYVAVSGKTRFVGKRKLKIFSGFWKYVRKKELNIFFTFNRLVFTNGFYLDKFIDPVIEGSILRDENYVIVDSPNYVGDYPRIHKQHVVDNEVRTISKQILKRLMLLIVPVLFKKRINSLFVKAQTVYDLPDCFVKQYNRMIALFVAEYLYDYCWFRLLRPKRVLIVFREGYFAQIAVCKRLGVPVAEFQHGITLDKTVSFAGDYDFRIDPDYFLTFGSYWKSEHFGMTDDRTFCIGWAYSQFIKHQLNISMKVDDVALVISSPEISDMILDAIQMLSEWNPSIKYHIRLHPSESYNESQNSRIKEIQQAEIVDNSNDSAVVLPQYKFVLGENSSVLYEALSYRCNVGLLNICGLQPPIDKPGITSCFSIIRNVKDCLDFFSSTGNSKTNEESFYSDFKDKDFENFVKIKM